MADQICWSRPMVQVVKGHLVPMSWKYSFETSKNKMSEATDVLAEVTGRERNETVFINSGSLCPSSRTPPALPSGWGHWHVSWWAWNSPSTLVHTNGPLNP